MNSLCTNVLYRIVFVYLEVLIMNSINRIKTSPKHVTLQNYVIEFIEQQAIANEVSFSKQLNSVVRMFMRHYDYK